MIKQLIIIYNNREAATTTQEAIYMSLHTVISFYNDLTPVFLFFFEVLWEVWWSVSQAKRYTPHITRPNLVNAKGLKVGSYGPRGGTSLFFQGSRQESPWPRVVGGIVIRLSLLTEIPVTSCSTEGM